MVRKVAGKLKKKNTQKHIWYWLKFTIGWYYTCVYSLPQGTYVLQDNKFSLLTQLSSGKQYMDQAPKVGMHSRKMRSYCCHLGINYKYSYSIISFHILNSEWVNLMEWVDSNIWIQATRNGPLKPGSDYHTHKERLLISNMLTREDTTWYLLRVLCQNKQYTPSRDLME